MQTSGLESHHHHPCLYAYSLQHCHWHAGPMPASPCAPWPLSVPCLLLPASWVFWPSSLPYLLSSLPSGCWRWAVGWRDEVRCRHIHILETQPFKDMASLNKHLKATLFSTREAEPRPGSGGWGGSLSGGEVSLLVQTPSLQGVLRAKTPQPWLLMAWRLCCWSQASWRQLVQLSLGIWQRFSFCSLFLFYINFLIYSCYCEIYCVQIKWCI